MQITGIVAEYNPFHNGHQYHIGQTKALQNLSQKTSKLCSFPTLV